MVKKKSRKKIIKAPVPKLDTVFNCPQCGHKKTVEVKFNKKEKERNLKCKACSASFTGKLKKQSAYIDIYYQWIDKLDRDREKEENNEESKNENEDEEDRDYEKGSNEENEQEEAINEKDNENENESEN